MTFLQSVLLIGSCLLSIVYSTEWATPMEIERVLKEDQWTDDGFMNFQDTISDWSSYSIKTKKCMTYGNNEVVVFDLYGSGNDGCNKKNVGTYEVSIETYGKALLRQKMLEYYMTYGKQMKMDKNAINYFTCTQYYYSNIPYYIKLGCMSGTGKGFQITAYTDSYCTIKASSTQGQQIYSYLANTVDMSSFKINFDYCQSCIVTKNGVVAEYAKLCSAVNYYKQTCDRSCIRASQDIVNKQHEGFTAGGKFFLFVFSFTGFLLLLAVLAQRKRMSNEDAFIEEAAVKSIGLEMKFIPRIILALIFFIALLILLHVKALTWFFLLGVNAGLLYYWIRLKYRAEGKVEVAGVHLFGNGTSSTVV